MAMDCYLWIDSLKGEAQAAGMKDYMELLSFSFGASNGSSFSSASGGGSKSKGELSYFSVMKNSEQASATLLQHCLTGEHFKKAKVVLRKATGKGGQAPFIEYEFDSVIVSSIQWSGSKGGDDVPTESLALAFDKVTVTYYNQAADGKTSKGTQAFWSVSKAALD
jgi:type VI secretion system secreted protein Hcp